MRAFIISVILLSVMAACVLLNYYYIQSLLDKMIGLTNDLPGTDSPYFGTSFSDAASLPYAYWKKNVGLASCTVNMNYISSVSDLAMLVESSFASGHKEAYDCSRLLLLSQLEEIKKAEKLSLLGIF